MSVWDFLLICFVNNLFYFRRLIMNHLQKHFSASLIALVALFSASSMAMAAPASSLSNFAILSAAPNQGGAVTLTNATIIGDVGSSGLPAAVVQTTSTVSGAIIAPVSASVVTGFNTALANGLALQCTTANTLTGTLAAQTLMPGVYCIDSVEKAGTLTLSGSATNSWTFIVGGGALTGTNFNVVMADGSAVPCGSVTWYVPAAATMTTSNFAGTIYAGAAITITGGTFNGDALAGAAVTVTGATITACSTTKRHHSQSKCNQGVGNGTEGCDPGNSNQGNPFNSNDESVNGEVGTPGDPGRQPDTAVTQ
jgi:hypothetical protein